MAFEFDAVFVEYPVDEERTANEYLNPATKRRFDEVRHVVVDGTLATDLTHTKVDGVRPLKGVESPCCLASQELLALLPRELIGHEVARDGAQCAREGSCTYGVDA